MKKKDINVCPGCSRHCPMNNLHCRRGRKYFAEMDLPETEKTKYKWEKYVSRNGLAHQLLLVTRKTRKALCKGKINEEKLLSALTEGEQAALQHILSKMAALTG